MLRSYSRSSSLFLIQDCSIQYSLRADDVSMCVLDLGPNDSGKNHALYDQRNHNRSYQRIQQRTSLYDDNAVVPRGLLFPVHHDALSSSLDQAIGCWPHWRSSSIVFCMWSFRLSWKEDLLGSNHNKVLPGKTKGLFFIFMSLARDSSA